MEDASNKTDTKNGELMKNKRDYMYLISNDEKAHDLIMDALLDVYLKNQKLPIKELKRLERQKILEWLEIGLEEALQKPLKIRKSQPIMGIILKKDVPFEKRLIDLKRKLKLKSSKVFVEAICIGIKTEK